MKTRLKPRSVKAAARRAGLTQVAIANALMLNRVTVCLSLMGERDPHQTTLRKIWAYVSKQAAPNGLAKR